MNRPAPSHILVAAGGVSIYSINVMLFAKDDVEAKKAAAQAAMCLHPQYFTFDLYRCDQRDTFIGRIGVHQPRPIAQFTGEI